MKLYLVRHGSAEPQGPADDLRQLTHPGIAEMQSMADFLRPLGIAISEIWHSGKVRAVQTAQIIATAVRCDHAPMAHPGLCPCDPTKPIARELSDASADLMIVSHEPMLGKLASRLVTGKASRPIVDLRKGAIACLARDADGEWKLEWLISPREMAKTR